MTTALVLAGHGSHISPHTASVVWQHVDRLRALGVADEVAAAFWKEPPSFHRVFESLTSQDITVIPIFTAQGYFTQTVIPTEMGLTGAITQRDERVIRYARTPNEHPELARIVRQRVETAREEIGAKADQIAVAVIGHSTRRNPESRQAAEQQVALLRSAGVAAEVIAVYLDDSPAIPDVYALTNAPILICVPFFVAAGSHTTLDVPARLGLQSGERIAEINGRTVIYTAPVGVEESLAEVILDLAREAGASLHESREGSAWDHFPAVGREELIAAVDAAGEMVFGDLLLSLNEVSAINPVMNYHAQRTKSLRDSKIITSPADLRAFMRGEYGVFRPLPTMRDL
ncbi:MAG: CbiX/SirB N-terminal domain-containing protein, partial [Anaerolineae bacterium]